MPARKSLAQTAAELGAIPVAQEAPMSEAVPEEVIPEEQEPEQYRPLDPGRIHGTFNGWPVEYVTVVDPENLGMHLAGLTGALQSFGVSPAVAMPPPNPAPIANGFPSTAQANQGQGGAAPGWNDTPVDQQGFQPPQQQGQFPPQQQGFQPQPGGYGQPGYAGQQGGFQPQGQRACPIHGAQHVRTGNYGPYCGFSSPNPFQGAKDQPKQNRNGQWTYYCAAKF